MASYALLVGCVLSISIREYAVKLPALTHNCSFIYLVDPRILERLVDYYQHKWGAVGSGEWSKVKHCLFAYTTNIVVIQSWL